MADLTYNKFKAGAFGSINMVGDTIKVMLVTSAYTPDKDHAFKSSVTNEVTGTGYTAGGQALTSKTENVDNTNDLGFFDAADVSWAASTITARGAVVYKDTGTAATSPLVAYYDFVTDKSSSSSDFTLQWNAGGLIAIT